MNSSKRRDITVTTAGTTRAKKKVIESTTAKSAPSLQVVETLTSAIGSKAGKAEVGAPVAPPVQTVATPARATGARTAKAAKSKRVTIAAAGREENIPTPPSTAPVAPAIGPTETPPSALQGKTAGGTTKRLRKPKAPNAEAAPVTAPSADAPPTSLPVADATPGMPLAAETPTTSHQWRDLPDLDSSASNTPFKSQQIRNLWSNFRRLDEFASGLVLEITQLRRQLDATENGRSSDSRKVRELQAELALLRERPDPAELSRVRAEAETWKQNYQAVFSQLNQLTTQVEELRQSATELEWLRRDRATLSEAFQSITETLAQVADGLAPLGLPTKKLNDADGAEHFSKAAQAFYRVSTAALTCPPTLNVDLRIDRIVPFYETSGLAGAVEEVELNGNNYQCTGWATTRMVPNIASLVAVFDDTGCLGYSYPGQPRQDVVAALTGCNPNCGFRVPLLRHPKGPLRIFLIVLLEGKAPFALMLPFIN
ncbi:hypothetical protein FBZ88_1383 [Nitrospirillum bahiense]|uniref:Uncharacterized protein n=1 Tax=Nitrospirillum amazonense TaxID=28077 RepID=A0A560EUR3_9PROT|nr:hypothetical protein FBZ88_1383 [Nitrospirillum amazonense]